MAKRLEEQFPILYRGAEGRVGHEFIIDLRPLRKTSGITEEDVAKRLMDYGYHAPTMSFPVPGTLMIEPTESESKGELDRFIDAMIAIRKEIQDIQDGIINLDDSPLKYAPHTQEICISNNWDRNYSREQAAYPLPYLRQKKLWASVSRVNQVWGDKNLFCSCG